MSLKLLIEKNFHIEPMAPYNFEKTVYKPSHFPEPDVSYIASIHRQSYVFEGNYYGIKMHSIGTTDYPKIDITIYSENIVSDITYLNIRNDLKFRFDMENDISPLTNALSGFIKWKGTRISTHVSLYEYLVIAVVLQNATVQRSVQMINNLFNELGKIIYFDNTELFAFWEPLMLYNLGEEKLRELKLGYRAKMLIRQANDFMAGKIEEKLWRSLSNEELEKNLLNIYGVGPASVGYLMNEVFKRYNYFKYISPWEQKIFSKLIFSSECEDIKKIIKYFVDKYNNLCFLAAHYMFEESFWNEENNNKN